MYLYNWAIFFMLWGFYHTTENLKQPKFVTHQFQKKNSKILIQDSKCFQKLKINNILGLEQKLFYRLTCTKI